MNIYMSIRKKNKISREELTERIGVPLKVLIAYEQATNPVPTLHFKERFKYIFGLSEEDLDGEIKTTKHI